MELTYAESGVDIDKEANGIKELVKTLRFKRKGEGHPIDLEGHFTGLIDFGSYALSLCTDSVGTKILIANELKKWDTIGIDCIAMSVNDAICVGAKPLAFVDYIAVTEVDEEQMRQIGAGLNRGAELSNMTIIGGETASVGDIVKELDIAGTCLAVVKKDRIITGKNIQPGDALIGLRSSGIHSNGYSLVRKTLQGAGIGYGDDFPGGAGKSWGDVLLEPTVIYVKPVLDLISKVKVKGLANITGGGMRNIPRLNSKIGFSIDWLPEPQPVFNELQRVGGMSDREMYQTFNMGIGFVAVVDSGDENAALASLKGNGVDAWRIGTVKEGNGVEVKQLGLKY
jgi:phosphoribosylformylglycinamidine cyclo-ligase